MLLFRFDNFNIFLLQKRKFIPIIPSNKLFNVFSHSICVAARYQTKQNYKIYKQNDNKMLTNLDKLISMFCKQFNGPNQFMRKCEMLSF